MFYNINVLSNGFNLLTTEMPNVRSVAINLIVKVGSRFETESELGIAHFLEHMAFKGTNNRTAKQIAQEFDNIGGHFNAYTSKEYTVYQAKILKENIETAFSILSDIIQNSLFDEEEIIKERDVINQEIAAMYDSPDDLVFEKFSEAAFGNSPLGRSILGTADSINKFGKQDLIEFTGKHHFAQNMYLSIAGNVKQDEMHKLAEKYFSTIKEGSRENFTSVNYVGGNIHIPRDLEQSTIVLGFESPGYMTFQDYYISHLISMILGGGISSRLFQEIRENKGLAYSVGSFVSSYNDTGLFSIYASTSAQKADILKKSMMDEVEKICSSIDISELERAKTQIKASFLMSEDSASYKSEEIGRNYSIFGRFITSEEIIGIIEGLQIHDLMPIVHKIFASKPTNASIGLSK